MSVDFRLLRAYTRDSPLVIAAGLLPDDAKAGTMVFVLEPEGNVMDSVRLMVEARDNNSARGALLGIEVKEPANG